MGIFRETSSSVSTEAGQEQPKCLLKLISGLAAFQSSRAGAHPESCCVNVNRDIFLRELRTYKVNFG